MSEPRPIVLTRPYRPADRQAVRDICAATCWMGEYRPELMPDDWVWAEYWTRYFTDQEPEHSWVAREGAAGRVVGYLTGTVDERRFHRYAPRALPGIAWHVIRHRLMRRAVSRRAIFSLVGALLRDEMRLPPGVAEEYPATCHIDLLPEARGAGVGTRLFAEFLAAMRGAGVSGVHQQPLDINPAILALLSRFGLRKIESHPNRAYAHIHPGKVELQTWVLRL